MFLACNSNVNFPLNIYPLNEPLTSFEQLHEQLESIYNGIAKVRMTLLSRLLLFFFLI